MAEQLGRRSKIHNGANMILFVQDGTQSKQHTSYIGGVPSLPGHIQLPRCELCHASQTFFFQIAFEKGHLWNGKSLAVFQCTSCFSDQFLIPDIPNHAPLRGVDLSSEFLRNSQKNYRFIVFPTDTAEPRGEYETRVAYQGLGKEGLRVFGRIGGSPDWVMEDETPGALDGLHPMVFLIQQSHQVVYPIVPGAPPQMEFDYFLDSPAPSIRPHYELFIRNELYFFGGNGKQGEIVYCLVQVPGG